MDKVYLFLLPEEHLKYFITDNEYGIAFGLEGGKFKAAYFSLNGSTKAIIEAKRIIKSLSSPIDKERKKSKYRDTTL